MKVFLILQFLFSMFNLIHLFFSLQFPSISLNSCICPKIIIKSPLDLLTNIPIYWLFITIQIDQSIYNIKHLSCCHCTLTLPIVTVLSSDQARCRAVPDLFIDLAGIRVLQTWDKALSHQHNTLHRLQSSIGLVSCSSCFVFVKAQTVYWKILYNCTFSKGLQ